MVGHLLPPGVLCCDLKGWEPDAAGSGLGSMGLQPCGGSQFFSGQGVCILTDDMLRGLLR